MSDSDVIQISSKPSWEHTVKELFAILGKRIIALPSKMLGFKPFCLYLATWLLVRGYIKDWIWFAVVVMVLFGIVELKVISRVKCEEWGVKRGGYDERFFERGNYRGSRDASSGFISFGVPVFSGTGPENL
jgi:hypothetical protein